MDAIHTLTVLTCPPSHSLQRSLHAFSTRFSSPVHIPPTASLSHAYNLARNAVSKEGSASIKFLVSPSSQLLALLLHPTLAQSVLHIHFHPPSTLQDILQRYSVPAHDVRIWDFLQKQLHISIPRQDFPEGNAVVEIYSRSPGRTPLVIRQIYLLKDGEVVSLEKTTLQEKDEPEVEIDYISEEQQREKDKLIQAKPWSVEYTMEKEDDWDEEEADEDLGF